MTQQQREQISILRASGASFGKIATELGISVNTVKSYCKRNPITAATVPAPVQPKRTAHCPQCNAVLEQSPGHRQKRFCSAKCRTAWWKAHPEQMERKKLFQVECRHCGTVFLQYGIITLVGKGQCTALRSLPTLRGGFSFRGGRGICCV